MRYLGILCLLTTMFATNIEFAHGQIEKLRGVCFSPIRDNESPARQITSLPSTVEADVEFASKIAGAMRTYTLSGSSYLIPDFCEKYNVDCLVGAWIGPARWQNDAQLELLERLADKPNPRIRAAIIGNEVLHRGDCSESQLIDYVRRAKAKLSVPIAVADTWKSWSEHPSLANEVDICGVQIYPYWEGRSIDGAAAYTIQRLRDVQAMYPNKKIVLTEFGWPTAGQSIGQAVASTENAARYMKEIIPMLEENKIEYYYFAIWDESWKAGPEGTVGAHWGLYQSNGQPKPDLKDLLPSELAKGTDRSARSITFRLEEDAVRNANLVELAVGKPSDQTPEDVELARSIGLEVPPGVIVRNSYSGLRTPNKTLPKIDAGEVSKTADRPSTDNSGADVVQKTENAAIDTQDSRTSAPGNKNAAAAKKRALLGPNELYGVCLGLFRDNETPHFGITPLVAELQADILFASKFTRAVRTYSVTDSFAFVPSLCNSLGVDCFPGAALGKYPWLNDLELEMLIRIGKTENPSIRALIVGNEVLHRGDFSIEQYIQYVRKVKQQVRVPVATAELLHSWLEHPELAAEVDILGVQLYPYWGGVPIEQATASTLESIQELKNRFPDKPVILTEFGWPTDGGTLGGAVASPENAARYLKEMIPVLNREGIEYLYFAMTDEKWKEGDEGGPGAHWGLLKSDGTMKESFRGMFSEEINKGMARPARQLSFED